MKTYSKSIIKLVALVFILSLGLSLNASVKEDKKQNIDTLTYNIYKGKILDQKTNLPLAFATIAVVGENTATISNSEGEFTLKIKKTSKSTNIEITHLGFKNLIYPITSLKEKRNILRMEIAVLTLDEITVYPNSAEYIVRLTLSKIPENYMNEAKSMTGFYREYIKKRKRYVALSEAVVEIYKTAYFNFGADRIKIYKGRKGRDVQRMDTLLFKLQGGPATTLLLDVARNPDIVFSDETFNDYKFSFGPSIKINDQLNFVIKFEQKFSREYPLFAGKLYINMENLALTAADYHLNLEKPEKAISLFIRKKPAGMKVMPVIASYKVTYREQDGRWYFNYAKGEVKFKIKWDKKLFSTYYTTMSEIAITDRKEITEKIKYKDSFKKTQIFAEKVSNFQDDDFWGEYNYIEPDQAIEVAIRKLKKAMRKNK